MDVNTLAGLILLIGIILGIALGVPIAVVIGVTSFVAIFVLLGNDPTVTSMNTASEVFTGINSFTLLAIPFFILAGGLMNRGGIAAPSNTFIVYSLVSSTSIAALFMAGVGPGIVWALAVMLVVALTHKRNRTGESADAAMRLSLGIAAKTLWRAVPSLLMIVIVIGGILGGYFTATESAAIAVVYCLILGMIYRTLRIKDLPKILVEAGRTTSIVMLLVGVSSALSFVMAFARVPDLIADLILGMTENPTLILLIIMVILLAVGTFMDPTPAILIFVPIFAPVVGDLGISPIHFGTMVVYAFSVGVITPPVGNVLFVGARIANLKLEPVIAKLLPFLVSIVLGLFVAVFVPQLSLAIPGALGML